MQTSDLKSIISEIKYRCKHTQKEIAENIGVKPTYLSDVINERASYNETLRDKIYEYYSDIFSHKNEGEMLKSEQKIELKSKKSSNVQMIPVLPIAAQGGTLNDFTLSINDSDCEQIVSPIAGADFAMPIAGDSMAPDYPSGSQVLVKKIDEKAFIEWGKTYVLDTCNGSVIKVLMPAESDDRVQCISINKDYPPFEVRFADIYGVYRVMMLMCIK